MNVAKLDLYCVRADASWEQTEEYNLLLSRVFSLPSTVWEIPYTCVNMIREGAILRLWTLRE